MKKGPGTSARPTVFVAVMAFVCVVLAAGTVSAASSSGSPVTLAPEMQRIVSYTFGDSREPLTVVEDMTKKALGDETRLRAIEDQFIAMLASDTTTMDCKDFICRQLWYMGSPASYDVLAAMLAADERSSHMARYALRGMSDPGAGEVLVKALGKTDGPARIGIINSIGERRSAGDAGAIAKYLSADDATAEAAATALGKIGGGKAVDALGKARETGNPGVHRAASQALLMVADGMMKRGDREEAADIYRALCSVNEPVPIRKAALVGLTAYLFD